MCYVQKWKVCGTVCHWPTVWSQTGVFDQTDGLGFGYQPEWLVLVYGIITFDELEFGIWRTSFLQGLEIPAIISTSRFVPGPGGGHDGRAGPPPVRDGPGTAGSRRAPGTT